MRYIACALALRCALCVTAANAQTFTTLLQFTGTGGMASGEGAIGAFAVSGTSLYGMTEYGGANGAGNVFSVGLNGSNFQNLVSFTGSSGVASGQYPAGGLTLSGTTLYGTTLSGGVNGVGNVFSVSTDGTDYQSLVSFTGSAGVASGWFPEGTLTLCGTTLYGVTGNGGANTEGNVFSVGTDGTDYQNLISFTGTGGATNGKNPNGSLTLSGTTLYGMTSFGGTNGNSFGGPFGDGYGNVFSVRADGTNYQNIVCFTGTSGAANGRYPHGELAVSGTTLYGMTSTGGTDGDGNVFSMGTDGTNYHNLVSFTGARGAVPGWLGVGNLVLSGTTLYGVTPDGGPYGDGYGDIFSVGIDGSGYEDLYNFTGNMDGAYPVGDLTLSGGTLFGMTSFDGNPLLNGGNGYGTVFALTLPTAPTPEPGTLALVGTASAVLVSYRWWRMRSRQGTIYNVQ